jgi:hypothetical protein
MRNCGYAGYAAIGWDAMQGRDERLVALGGSISPKRMGAVQEGVGRLKGIKRISAGARCLGDMFGILIFERAENEE